MTHTLHQTYVKQHLWVCVNVLKCIIICIYLSERVQHAHTTFAVKCIMSFNSSTPKMDGSYNSCILATAKKPSQRRWLSSGWDQAHDSTPTPGGETAELSSQPKYSKYVLFTYSNKAKQVEKTTKTKLKLSPGQKSFNNPQPTFPENKTDTLYYQHEYLQYSQMIQDGSFQNAKHVLFHYYCTVKMTPITQKNEHKFQAPPLWQLVCCVDTESLDYREVKHEIYSGPSSVCMKEMDRRLYMRSGHSQL